MLTRDQRSISALGQQPMLKRTTPLVASSALACLCTLSSVVNSEPNAADAATAAVLSSRRAALVAQCPSFPQISPAEAANLPMHVTQWGAAGPRIIIIHGGEQSISAIGGGLGLGIGPDRRCWASENGS